MNTCQRYIFGYHLLIDGMPVQNKSLNIFDKGPTYKIKSAGPNNGPCGIPVSDNKINDDTPNYPVNLKQICLKIYIWKYIFV